MNVIVEFLEEKYYSKACDLINRVFKNEDNKIDVNSIKGKINNNINIFSARINEDIIGIIVTTILDKPFSNHKYLYLDYVCTDINYRNMGIGKLMMEKVEEYAKDNNCAYITFTSNPNRISAHAFYKKLDYKIVETCVFKKEI